MLAQSDGVSSDRVIDTTQSTSQTTRPSSAWVQTPLQTPQVPALNPVLTPRVTGECHRSALCVTLCQLPCCVVGFVIFLLFCHSSYGSIICGFTTLLTESTEGFIHLNNWIHVTVVQRFYWRSRQTNILPEKTRTWTCSMDLNSISPVHVLLCS